MSKRFYRILKIGLIGFISAISLLLVVGLAFDIHDRKLLLYLFPRPALSVEVLENYWKHPLPIPASMHGLMSQAKNGESFCISINPNELGIMGDTSYDIYQSVQKSFELYIDGRYHKPPVSTLLIEFTDSFGSEMSACVKLKDLSIGLHSAEVQFSDLHGRIYAHIWAFKVTS